MIDSTLPMFSEFLSISTQYIIYLQQFPVLLITAITIIYYKNKDNSSMYFNASLFISLFLTLINLVIGCFMFSEILESIYQIINHAELESQMSEFKEIIKSDTKLWELIYWQIGFSIFSLILIILSVISLRKEGK